MFFLNSQSELTFWIRLVYIDMCYICDFCGGLSESMCGVYLICCGRSYVLSAYLIGHVVSKGRTGHRYRR
jgi:hypothetical protein